MANRILTPKDKIIVPDYVGLFDRVLEEISPFYNEEAIRETKSRYTQEYIENNLRSDSERFIGHFTGTSLDGLLIEGFDNLDGNRTVIRWVMAGKKGKGIGTDLIMDCISRAKREHKDNVALGVSLKNTLARNLYKKLGFISGGTYINNHGLLMEVMGYIF